MGVGNVPLISYSRQEIDFLVLDISEGGMRNEERQNRNIEKEEDTNEEANRYVVRERKRKRKTRKLKDFRKKHAFYFRILIK